MQTQSHFLVSGLIGQQLQRRGISVHQRAWLLGSVLPDIPLGLLTVAGTYYYRWSGSALSESEIHQELHFDRFFTDPLWIASHNFFHSLVIGGLLLALGWWAWRAQRGWGRMLFWFAIATLFHTVIDIFTHNSDGPLFLFPLTWSYRFASPISYWEEEYYGRQFGRFEIVLDGLIVFYFAVDWVRKWLQRPRVASEVR